MLSQKSILALRAAFAQSLAIDTQDHYAKRYKGEKTPSLFGEDDKPTWITIGGEPGADGKKHGGHPVMINKEGRMVTGHFAGMTLAEAFGPVGKKSDDDRQKPDYDKRLDDLKKRRDPEGIESNESMPLFDQSKQDDKPKRDFGTIRQEIEQQAIKQIIAGGKTVSGKDVGSLFHGTAVGNDFDKFDVSKGKSGNRGNVIYLTENPHAAKHFGRYADQDLQWREIRKNPNRSLDQLPVERDPAVLEFKLNDDAKVLQLEKMPHYEKASKVIAEAKSQGYDAIQFPDDVWDNETDAGGHSVKAFEQTGGRKPNTTIVLNEDAYQRVRKEKPAIELPQPKSNVEAKPGDQLGLFGDMPPKQTFKPTLLNQPNAKQSNLFDTHGNANQMDLFGDKVMPEDLVYKPKLDKGSDGNQNLAKTYESDDAMRKAGMSEDDIAHVRAGKVYHEAVGDPSKATNQQLSVAAGYANLMAGHFDRSGKKDLSKSFELEADTLKNELKRRNREEYEKQKQSKANNTEKPDRSNVSKHGIEDFGEKIGGARKDTATKIGPRAKKEDPAKDDQPAWKRRYRVGEDASRPGEYFVVDERTKQPFGPGDIKNRNSFSAMMAKRLASYGRKLSDFKNFPSKKDAEDAVAQIEVNRNHAVRNIAKAGEPANYAIYRKISDSKRPVVKSGFASADEAEQYMSDHPESVIEHEFPDWEDYSYLDSVKREGKEHREGGRDVKPKDFQDAFNFRGGEFGKWQMNKDGQTSLNHAYDALHDLAGILNLPPRAMSLDGKLAIAFGSRGTGGKHSAKAHYEPDKAVINLTKMKGAGSLAHEWFHALDHYVANQVYGETANRGAGNALLSENLPRGEKHSGRKEVVDAWRYLVNTINSRDVTEKVVGDDKRLTMARKSLSDSVDKLDSMLESNKSYNKRFRSFTPEQQKEWDEAKQKIKDMDVGEKTSIEGINGKLDQPYSSRGFSYTPTYAPLQKLNELYKKATGRSFHTSDASSHGKDLYWQIQRTQLEAEKIKRAEEGATQTKKTSTQFLDDAHALDEFRSGDYYSKDVELAARAFQAYIYDKTEAKNTPTQYLNAKAHNKYYEGIVTNDGKPVRPFPEGKERDSINDAFDKLFSALSHKEREDEKGTHVHLYSARYEFYRYLPSIGQFDREDLYYCEDQENYARCLYQILGCDTEYSRDSYEWNESLHPREPSGKPTGGEFKRRSGGSGSVVRELAEVPMQQSHHSLHAANQSNETKLFMGDAFKGFKSLLGNAQRKVNMAAKRNLDDPVDEETIWQNVDKKALQSLLDEINEKDRQMRAEGKGSLSDLFNYNQVIPQSIAKRLHGGSRFFDPTKLRGRWWEPQPQGNAGQQSSSAVSDRPSGKMETIWKPSTSESSQTQPTQAPAQQQGRTRNFTVGFNHASIQFQNDLHEHLYDIGAKDRSNLRNAGDKKHNDINDALNSAAQKLKVSPAEARSIAAHVYRDTKDQMKGVQDGETRAVKLNHPSIQPSSGSANERQPGDDDEPFESPSPGSNSTQSESDDGLSKVMRTKVNKAISNLIGPNQDMIDAFRPILVNAWKQKVDETKEHNQAVRQITGATAKTVKDTFDSVGRPTGTSTVQSLAALTRRARANTHDASNFKKGFDSLVQTAESQYPHLMRGRGEDGLMDLIGQGIKPMPHILDDDVAELAMSMAGPSFFEHFDQGQAPSDWDAVPFSSSLAREAYSRNHWEDQVRNESGQWTNEEMPVVEESKLESVGDSSDKIRDRLKEWAMANLRGKSFFNADKKWSISIDKTGIKKIASQQIDSAMCLLVLPELIEKSKFDHSKSDEKRTDGVDTFHYFNHAVQYKGKPWAVRTCVREIKNSGMRAYSLHAVEIKKGSPQIIGGSDRIPARKIGEPSEINIDKAWGKIKSGNDFYHLDVESEHYQQPTAAQREAGNYRKQHTRVAGLGIAIETRKGSRRRPEWPKMAADYGYIKRTIGKDGDNLDVFIGPNRDSELVYVIDQVSQDGKFDEHKIMLGFNSYNDAVAAYKRCYTPGWRVGHVTAMTIGQFKNWIKSGKHNQPIEKQVSRYSHEWSKSTELDMLYSNPSWQDASAFFGQTT